MACANLLDFTCGSGFLIPSGSIDINARTNLGVVKHTRDGGDGASMMVKADRLAGLRQARWWWGRLWSGDGVRSMIGRSRGCSYETAPTCKPGP